MTKNELKKSSTYCKNVHAINQSMNKDGLQKSIEICSLSQLGTVEF